MIPNAKIARQTYRLARQSELVDFTENVQLIVDAGFPARQSSALRYSQLPAPIIVRASSTGRKGEVRIVVDDRVASRSVLMHAIEYSLDRNGWQNGASTAAVISWRRAYRMPRNCGCASSRWAPAETRANGRSRWR